MNESHETTPHGFCVTKPSTCTMNYCDDNGCQDRKRNLVEVTASGDTAKQGEAILGVGDGTGQHFVRGEYETIKLLQSKILRWEKIEEENARLIEENTRLKARVKAYRNENKKESE